jgi:hypothetical protein
MLEISLSSIAELGEPEATIRRRTLALVSAKNPYSSFRK